MTQQAIEITNLTFSYDKRSKPILNIPAWQVDTQQHTFLYGPSGSGKSTLLNLLTGINTPTSGDIQLLGQPFSDLSQRKKDAFRAQHIGVVFQEFNLIPYLSVWDNLKLSGHFAKTPVAQLHAWGKEILNKIGLSEAILQQKANTLSVGQRQRVAIARALVNRPELLIADEPTSALDTNRRDEFMDLLFSTLENTQTTLLFVSHDHSLGHFFNQSVDLNEINQAEPSSCS